MANTPTDPSEAQAWISGTPPDQTVDFYIPRGNVGPTGPRGPIGPSVIVGDIITTTGQVAQGQTGPMGPPGVKGDPGGLVMGPVLDNTNANAVLTAGLYRLYGGPNITKALNWPQNGQIETAVVEVLTVNTDWVTQIFYPVGWNNAGQAFYSRTMRAGVWGTWRAFNSTRIDQTAGRTIYQWDDLNNREQLIYGDTGWRSIIGMFPTRTSGRIEVRRMGNIVYFLTEAATFSNSAAGLNITFDLGSGWSSEATCFLLIDNSAEDSVIHRVRAAWDGRHELKFKSGFGFQGMVSWVTKDPWPATLPGVASGTIQNV